MEKLKTAKRKLMMNFSFFSGLTYFYIKLFLFPVCVFTFYLHSNQSVKFMAFKILIILATILGYQMYKTVLHSLTVRGHIYLAIQN
jgi:hypothetical protein